MEFYSELIDGTSLVSFGFVKVILINTTNAGQTVVTTDGNHFFNLSSVGCQLRPIMINDAVLIQSQFVKGVTKYLLNLNPPEEVYQKTYKSGWSIDVLFDGQNYYYLEPASLQPQGFIKRQIATIEQLQSELFARERREITLPLLNTVLNKQKLKDALTAQLTRRYICFVGGSNGNLVDNDPNRPDYQYLKMDPIALNSEPAVIELNHFRAQGCTIAFIIQQDVIQYTYGMSFQDVVASHPHLAKVFAQYSQYLKDLYYSVNNAVEDALTC